MRNREVRKPVSVVAAGTTTYDVALPNGTYEMSVFVKSSVTGTTTSVQVFRFVDKARTRVEDLPLPMWEPNDTTHTVTLTLAAGSAGKAAKIGPSPGGIQMAAMPTEVVGGLQISVVQGGASVGEELEIMIVATRVA